MLIGVLSDAHGHVGAFDQAWHRLRSAGAEEFYYLGDAVGYIPQTGVVDRIMTHQVRSIRGNHEVMLLSHADTGEREAVYQLHRTRERLSASALRYLADLPAWWRTEHADLTMLFVHGSPADPTNGYVYPDTDLTQFADVDADVVFLGHTHHPFARAFDDRMFINVGSVGLPRDNTGLGAACIFDTQSRQAEIVRFDISASARDILSRGEVAPAVAKHLKRCLTPENHGKDPQ